MQDIIFSIRHWIDRHRFSICGSLLLIFYIIGGSILCIALDPALSAPLQGVNCGTISFGMYHEKVSDQNVSLQALDCYWSAYQHCESATIKQTFSSIDTGGGDQIMTLKKWYDQCIIYDQEAFSSGPRFWESTSKHVYTCSTMTRQKDGLHVADCDRRDPFIISPIVIIYQHCTTLFHLPGQATSCFYSAFQDCSAKDLSAIIKVDGALVQQRFIINGQCGIDYQRASYKATCHSVIWHSNGLQFLACGKDGNIFISEKGSSTTSHHL
jgi:hypothetical protein